MGEGHMTGKEISDRRKKAEELEVTIIGGAYLIKSSTGKGGYMVTESEGKLVCACTDFYMHIHQDPDWKCKHIIAAEIYGEKRGTTKGAGRFALIDLN